MARLYTSRAVQREDEADGGYRESVERERKREGNAQQSLPVAVGDRAGWRFRRGRGRTTPLGSVSDAGVVATAVVAAMGNAGLPEGGRRKGRGEGGTIFPSERGNRGKERSVTARERRNGG